MFGRNELILNDNERLLVLNISFKSDDELRLFLKRKAGIYFWVNLKDKKLYIGSAICLWRRFSSYINTFNTKDGKNNKRLRMAVNKHELNNFRFGLLEILNNDKILLKTREQILLDTIKPFKNKGYNISKSAWRPLHCKISKKGRERITLSTRGEKSHFAKLTAKKVLIIKKELVKGTLLKVLARRFKVSTTVISNIKRNDSWKHIKLSEIDENKIKESVKKHKHKWSDDFIKKLKTELKNGVSPQELSIKYNIPYPSICNIKDGHRRSNVICD